MDVTKEVLSKMKGTAQTVAGEGPNQTNQHHNNIWGGTRQVVTPYQMNELMKVASKIMNQLTNIPSWSVNFRQIELVLEMLLQAVRAVEYEGIIPKEEE
jgi:hypothetical protein